MNEYIFSFAITYACYAVAIYSLLTLWHDKKVKSELEYSVLKQVMDKQKQENPSILEKICEQNTIK